MKTLFFRLISDARFLVLLFAISTITYIHLLQKENRQLKDEVVLLNERIEQSNNDVERKDVEILNLEKVFESDCQARIDIILKTKVGGEVLTCEVEKTKNLEVVEEKNILGSKLPESILEMLRRDS